jgi:hypothetical protein
MSPILLKKNTLICKQDQNKNNLLSNVNVETPRNPLLSSVIDNVQHSSSPPTYDTSQVLTMNSDVDYMSSKQRHFIKASTLIEDETDEIVNDLMNIVADEKLKIQGSIKRHASFEQISYSDDYTMNKKRYFHHKKSLINSLPPINNNNNNNSHQQKINSRIDYHLLRPEIVLNRYGDIGNYVPKFLRENIAMRSSDSNENIFFRSTNGQLLNGFLKLDVLPITENHYQSTPCLNQQLQKNVHIDGDHRVSHVLKSIEDVLNGIKIHPFTHQHPLKSNIPPSSSKRVASFTIADTKLPVDYRQYLRHTDQATYLYGEEQRQQTILGHSLGYFP